MNTYLRDAKNSGILNMVFERVFTLGLQNWSKMAQKRPKSTESEHLIYYKKDVIIII